MNKSLFFNIAFLLIQTVMIVFAVTLSGNVLHYFLLASIASCLIFSILVLIFKKNTADYLITMGLIFTFIADFFLMMFDPQEKLLAIISFSIVQIIYAIYLSTKLENHKTFWWIFRGVTIVVAEIITIFVLKEKLDALSIISMFYFASLLTNLIISLTLIKKIPFFAIGLIFFILCDILVGLGTLFQGYMSLDPNSILYKIVFSKFNLIWFFYIPAQTLIALSTYKINPFKNTKKSI